MDEMWLFVGSWDFTPDFPSSPHGHSIHWFPGNLKLWKMNLQHLLEHQKTGTKAEDAGLSPWQP